MPDNVDFKAAKEWARRTVGFCEYWATGGEPSKTYGGTYDCAKGFLALCELLKDALPIVEKATPYTEMYRAKIEARIKAAIGA